MNNIYLNSKISSEIASDLRTIFYNAFSMIDEMLSLNTQNFDVYFSIDENDDSSEITIFPETYASGLVNICLKKEYNQNELIGELFHELSHVKWSENHDEDDGYELFNFMINEGVAENIKFDLARKNKIELPKYVGIHELLSDEEILIGLSEVIKITDKNLEWDKTDWFYNFAKNAKYEVNFGYHIGMFVVQKYLEFNAKSIYDIFNEPYEKFYNFAKKLIAESNEKREDA